MNWVEKRAQSDRILMAKSEDSWSDVCQAIREACSSFNAHYHPTDAEVSCEAVNGGGLRVTRICSSSNVSSITVIDFSFDPRTYTIEAKCIEPCQTKKFSMVVEGEKIIILEGANHCGPDEVSQRCLEQVFFSNGSTRPWESSKQ